MRISTSMLHQQGVSNLQKQQAQLAHTQNQLTANRRLLTAADDPAAMSSVIGLEHAEAQFARYQDQIDVARQRLGLEENVLADTGTALQRVRELALQLNSGTQSVDTRRIIANELRQIGDQLLSLANTDDGQGHYLFAGSQNGSPPFAGSAGNVSYAGDQQQRLLSVTNSRTVADADAGSEVFQRLRDGNGTFSVAADAGNTGSAALKSARVVDAELWDGGSYTLSFSAGNYEIRDGGNAVVAGGAYADGQTIAFRGIDLGFSGTPADGDRFTVGASAQRDLFAQVEELARIAESPIDTEAQRAVLQTRVFQSLSALDNAEQHVSDVRSSVGNRLAVLDDAENQNGAQKLQVSSTLADLRDLDYAEAATRLNLQMTALQAAQQTYARVQSLSLFDYLR